MNYRSTLILVADDCAASSPIIPQPRGGKPTVATIQYALLHGHPHEYTQEDVLLETYIAQNGLSPDALEKAALRTSLFEKERPCLRASPLAKQYGWGFLFDAEGRVALVGVGMPEYQQAKQNDHVKKVKAMRGARK